MLACSQGLVAQVSTQGPVAIRVDASARQGPWKPIWTYFGYDEPNYTYTQRPEAHLRALST